MLNIVVGGLILAGVIYILRKRYKAAEPAKPTPAAPAPAEGGEKEKAKDDKKGKKDDKKKDEKKGSSLLKVAVFAIVIVVGGWASQLYIHHYWGGAVLKPAPTPGEDFDPADVVQLQCDVGAPPVVLDMAEKPIQVEVIGNCRVTWAITCPIKIRFNNGREIVDRPGKMQAHIPYTPGNNIFRVYALDGCKGPVTFTLTPRR